MIANQGVKSSGLKSRWIREIRTSSITPENPSEARICEPITQVPVLGFNKCVPSRNPMRTPL